MVTGSTPISQLPTGTIDGLNALLVLDKGMPSSPQTIRSEMQAVTEFAYMGYSISPSISTGGLVLAIKGYNGSDPSASNPCRFTIGSSFYYATGTVSFTAPSGTNWCNAGSAEIATNDVDFFVYAIAETGASAGLKFGFSRIPYGETMNDFSSTSTAETYIKGNYTNKNATDKVINIGRFRARLSASTTYVWSIPNSVIINRPIFDSGTLTWTPTVTSQGGSPTTVTTVSKYKFINNAMIMTTTVTVTNRGTATGAIILTPPLTASVATFGFGMETAVLGVAVAVYLVAGGNINIYKYDGTTLWTNSYVPACELLTIL